MRVFSISSCLALGLAVGLVACGDDDGAGGPDAATSDAAPPIDALQGDASFIELPEAPPGTPPVGVTPTVNLYTFNTGLIDRQIVKAPVERRPLIIAAIKASDADVVCLQEVYSTYGGPEQMAADLADTFPHAFWSWSGSTVYGNGLLIVSKHPLFRGRELMYPTQPAGTVVDRMLIAANVLTDTSYFTVMCTHMAAGLLPGDNAAKSAEVDEGAAFATAEGYDDGPTVWLGDFNFGPEAIEGITCPADPDCCVLPECDKVADTANYAKIQTKGFIDPNTNALGSTSPRSVFMPLDALGFYDDEPSQRLDHCFYRGMPAVDFAGGSIVFDEDPAIAYDGPGSPQGGETIHTLSDHLGVRCRFRPE